jgi:hypothetical protein
MKSHNLSNFFISLLQISKRFADDEQEVEAELKKGNIVTIVETQNE